MKRRSLLGFLAGFPLLGLVQAAKAEVPVLKLPPPDKIYYKTMICLTCGEKLTMPSSESLTKMPKDWCRYQFGVDSGEETPWFCCPDHMIEHVMGESGAERLSGRDIYYENGMKCELSGRRVPNMVRKELITFIGFLDEQFSTWRALHG